MPTARAVPLHLVTGFLGSGKTTLINRVLREPGFAGTMVVVNEFGEVGLDHLIVSSAQDNVLLLESGCLCCAASGTLRDTLIDLFSRRATGAVPAFDRLIVETSGLANPGPIVASLLGDSALRPRCELVQVLTLVDAMNGAVTLDKYPEAARQVAFADRILLTKVREAPREQVPALEAQVRALNSHARMDVAQGDVPATSYFEATPLGHRPPATPNAWLRGPLKAQYGGDEAVHGDAFGQIATHTFAVPHAVDWQAYAAWCDGMRRKFGRRLLRCKGLLKLGDTHVPWIVQGVQGFFAPPVKYTGMPAEGFIVCIGEDLDRGDLDDIFTALQAGRPPGALENPPPA
ncbi:MAG: GTP-binding protein [Pseudomonadota bacterium]